jgi:CSLREA domain-containing protein
MPSSDLTCTAEFDSLGAAQDGPTYTVTTEDDTDDGFCGVETCSLRDAVAAAQANDGGTIEFAPGVDNVAVTSTITVAGGVTLEIDGNGIATTTINGSGFDTESNGWVFEVDNDTELDLHDLAITGARDNAAYVNGGTLSLDDVDLHDNAATNDSGGGVYVDDGGTLDASGGSIRFNQADHDGGAVFVADGSVTLEGVTVTGNVAGDAGGGIYGEGDSEIRLTSGTTVIDNGAYGDGGGGIVVVDGSELALTDVAVVGNVGAGGAIVIATDQDNTLTNVTITINTSDAGLDAEGAATLTNVTITRNTGSGISSGGAVELENSLVAANDDSNCNGTVESLGHNLDDDGSCSLDGAGDLSDVDDARLGALSSGVVPLLSGSPALDAGADLSDGFTDDQRGVSRPQGGAWDIGAYEAAEHKLTLATDGSGSIAADPSPTTGGWYVEGTAVTLTATPADGVTFTGWNADCSDAGPGTVTMSANRSCTATFSDAGAGGGSGGGGSSGGGGTTSGGTTTGDGSASTTITDGTATVSQTLTVAPHLSVTVPAGTLTPGTVVTVTQTVSTGSTGFGADGTVLDLRVTGPGGTRITTFDPPLQLEFPPEPEGWVPGYSEDGKHWTPIPRLSSPSLPAAWPDGYYVQADGSILVFTRHATLFGVLHDTQAPAAPAKPAVTYAKGKLFFSWPAALDNSGSVASYTILRNGKAIRSLAGRQVALVSSAGLFAVVAVDAAGNTSESSPAVTVKLAPRPAAIPKRIPAWAWTMLHRRGNASVPRPAAAPKRLPRWYWSWAAWRQRPFVVS